MLRLQRMVGNRAVRQLIEDRGAPLDPGARHGLEQFFGCDLSTVRVRTGSAADSLCQAVGGDGFAVGDDVVIRTDRTAPSTAAQLHFLAHEVAHVVQQRQGRVEGEPGPEGVRLSKHADRFERAAELAATQFTARYT